MKKTSNPNPPWQDLNPFLLSKIFSCLSLQDQLFSPPQVCRSWLHATIHTLFPASNLNLENLDKLEEVNQRSRFTNLLQVAVDHYKGWVSIRFPCKYSIHYFGVLYIAERTPNICNVSLPCGGSHLLPVFASLMYWNNLRVFDAYITQNEALPFLHQLADHCKKLEELGVHGDLAAKESLCIANGFTLLKVLDLSNSILRGDALIIFLNMGIRELNILHCSFVEGEVKLCTDYEKMKEFKKKILEKAYRLKTLKNFRHCFGIKCQYCKLS